MVQAMQKVVRYQNKSGQIYYGLAEDGRILQISSDFGELVNENTEHQGVYVEYSDVKILEPVAPSKVINFGWTYPKHAEETGGQAHLKEPFLFLKPATCLIPNGGSIMLPPRNLTQQVEMEGEVALVVGKRGKNIKEEEALDYIFGCTIFNDVTARDLTKTDPQFTRGKGFDTFGPLGPWIVTGVDPTNLQITTTLNDKVVQEGNTNQMSFSVPYLISWISQIMTLEPGDILATGSPPGSCPMQPGDVVSVEVENIGKLVNHIA